MIIKNTFITVGKDPCPICNNNKPVIKLNCNDDDQIINTVECSICGHELEYIRIHTPYKEPIPWTDEDITGF